MNIALIGMAGVGKSALGEELAKRLNYRFLDIDEVIEKKTKLRLQEIIDSSGEDEFLKIEEKAVLGLGELDRCVISPGGSVVYSKAAMGFLKENSVVVFLDASFESINGRITNHSTRGIIGLKNKSLKELFEERLPLYKKYADITIEMPLDFNANAAVDDIIREVSQMENKLSELRR